MTRDPFEVLETQLVNASLPARDPQPRAHRPGHRFRRRSPLIAVAAALLLLAGVGGAAAALHLVGASDKRLPADAPRALADVASPSMKAHFSIVDRARDSGDELSSPARSLLRKAAGEPDYDGANPSLARRADLSVGKARIWIVPGNDAMCVIAVAGPSGGGGCASTEQALTGTFHRVTVSPDFGLPGGEALLYGLVPDGPDHVALVTAQGDVAVPVRDNAWAVSIPFGSARTLVVGAHRVPIDAPAPPSGAPRHRNPVP
jgi:hypothetical protein